MTASQVCPKLLPQPHKPSVTHFPLPKECCNHSQNGHQEHKWPCMLVWIWGKGMNPCILFGGKKWYRCLEIQSGGFSKEMEIIWPTHLTPAIHPADSIAYCRDFCSSVIIVAPLAIAKKFISQWMNHEHVIHIHNAILFSHKEKRRSQVNRWNWE